MEKVRQWCGQPSDRGRLRNRTDTAFEWKKCDFRVSPFLSGSAEAQVIWDGTVKRLLIAYFIGNISAKKIWKCVHVCQSYSKANVGRFLRHSVYAYAYPLRYDVKRVWRRLQIFTLSCLLILGSEMKRTKRRSRYDEFATIYLRCACQFLVIGLQTNSKQTSQC